ncbi:MAG: polymerase, sigma-24 subunit, subfamily [Acidimicrobiales bacterium]|nr:polymerase, sigma-24 subunit, subfamily [Acidimicrobiales bacterium]
MGEAVRVGTHAGDDELPAIRAVRSCRADLPARRGVPVASEPITAAVEQPAQPKAARTDPAATPAGPEARDDRWDRLAKLYRTEQAGLVRLATLLTDDHAVAEELVQEAFVRLHAHLDRADRPGAYLRTTVVNLSRGHHRRRAVADRHPPEQPRSTPEPTLPHDHDPVWLALQELPDRRRIALILRFYLDLPDDEIGRILGARPGTIRSLVSRGLSSLKKELEP